jgi:hypothetical protein
MSNLSDDFIENLLTTLAASMQENRVLKNEINDIKNILLEQNKKMSQLENTLGNLPELTKHLIKDNSENVKWIKINRELVCSHKDAAYFFGYKPSTFYNKKKEWGLVHAYVFEGQNYYRQSDMLNIQNTIYNQT